MATKLSDSERFRLDSGLASICDVAGLDSSGAELLHYAVNAVYQIDAGGVVVRMTGGSGARSQASFVARVAAAFAELDLPTIRLAPRFNEPVDADGWSATVWTLLPQPPDRRFAPVDLAAPLRAMHAVTDAMPDLPTWDTVGTARDRLRRLVDDHDAARLAVFRSWASAAVGVPLPDLVERLMRRCDELDAALRAVNWTLPRSLVHGDAHLRNLLWTPDDTIVVCDFDSVASGPPEWDLVPAVHGVVRYRDDPARNAAFVDAYGFDVTQSPGWDVLRLVRDLQLVASVIANVPAQPDRADELAHRVRTVLADDDTAVWHRFA